MLPSVSLAAVVGALLSGAASGPSQTPLVFGREGAFAIVDRTGKLLERVSDLCGKRPRDLAVAPDRRLFAFTAWSEEARNTLLYACRRGEPARLVGEATGFHAQPSFSEDGSWLYFVHHPKKGGPPGQHDEGANAQVYKVQVDGTGLQELTDSRGCKISPRPTGNSAIVFVHTTCAAAGRSVVLRKEKRLATLAADNRVYHYPDLSSDGRWLLFTEQLYGRVQLVELDLKTRRERVITELADGAADTQAAWSSARDSVLYFSEGAVWRVAANRRAPAEQLFKIEGDT